MKELIKLLPEITAAKIALSRLEEKLQSCSDMDEDTEDSEMEDEDEVESYEDSEVQPLAPHEKSHLDIGIKKENFNMISKKDRIVAQLLRRSK